MHDLIQDIFLKILGNPFLNKLGDAAVIRHGAGRLAFTSDSFVVKPLFFPGGDIGKLAVCGTVNDLVMMGARPHFIACAMIVEEGFPINTLEKITRSLAAQAEQSAVKVVTGDFKVVEKGACDGIFINTTGIGEVFPPVDLSVQNICPGDQIIINGPLGLHGIAVLSARKQLSLQFKVKSDCAALDGLILPLLKERGAIKFMRDPTRGGLATTLNEIALPARRAISLIEKAIPLTPAVKSACEMLGFDPLYLANEGKAVMIVAKDSAEAILAHLKRHPLGRQAKIIGGVMAKPQGKVFLNTSSGGRRVVDMLVSDSLPRIC